ncbi:uncharacterized protein WCC33_000362 [Rhinophrynus dorsalis]
MESEETSSQGLELYHGDTKHLVERAKPNSPVYGIKDEPVEWLISDVRSLAETQHVILSTECVVSESLVLKLEKHVKEESETFPTIEHTSTAATRIKKEIKEEEESLPVQRGLNSLVERSPKKEDDLPPEPEDVKPLKQELEKGPLAQQIGNTAINKLKRKQRRKGPLSCKAKKRRHVPSPDTKLFFKCETCDKVIKHLANFKEHERIHTGERPYNCKVCKKTFKSGADLNKHQLVHSNRRPHKCKTCGKRFKLAGHLDKHSTVHSDKFPFKCESCDKVFKRTSCLIKHMRIHTEEKPFACLICGKRFKWESSVREHRRIHSGEKPFQCPDCEKRFTHFSTFLQHKRTHGEDAPFSCDLCNRTFNYKSNFLKHQRAAHS